MKKITLLRKFRIPCKLLIWMLLIFPITYQVRAQFVELPDSNFRKELRVLYPDCFNTSGFLDTTCTNIVNAKVLKVESPYIFWKSFYDLTGLEYFKNLEELDLTGHGTLKTIPIFPEKLRRFICFECDLEELPMFNDSLRVLNIENNRNFRCLNILPNHLDTLQTKGTDLKCMPNMVDGLFAQPSLPICNNTCDPNYDLVTIPDVNFRKYLERWIPHSMIFGKLDTNYNKILPPVLIDFVGYFSDDVFSLEGLQYLTNITSIRTPNQKISFVPDLSNLKNLTWIEFQFNEIVDMPKLPASVISLSCSNNLLQSLPELPESLILLSCQNNQLTSLPTLPKAMRRLGIADNPLTCLPYLPFEIEVIDWSFSISCIPNHVLATIPGLIPLCTDTLAICDFRRCDSILCVLPGDADHDRTVNNFDIFGIGLSYNKIGQERPAGTQDYMLQPTLEWNTTHHYGFNDKFADCNGDGIINDADALVVDNNYIAQAQNVYNYRRQPDDSVPPVFLLFESMPTFTFNGTCNVAEIVGDIMVGTPTNAVENLFGMAFSVEYPEEFVSPDCMSVSVELDADSWFQTNDPILLFYKNIPEFHRVDIAITRTDAQPRSGNGRVGKIKLITEGDIFGVRRGGDNYTFDFNVKDVAGVDTSGKEIQFNGQSATQEFIVTQITSPKIENLRMYPNPAANVLLVQANETISSIRVYGITGNLLMEQTGRKNDYMLNLKDLAPGILMVEIRGEHAVEFVKVLKQ